MKLDRFSYHLGAADCFCEMVRDGVKRIALSHPCDSRQERDAFLPEFDRLCEKYGVQLKKNDLSQYISGKVEPKQDKLSILGMALKVNEVWLMGYNVPAGRDELAKLEQRLQNEVAACEMFEQCYGKEAFQAVKLFLQLDTLDQGRIIGSMETLLEDEKYSIQKESLNGKAI